MAMSTILVTGTSSGIGRETAILFAQKGWKVVATMRDTEHLSLFAGIENITTYILDVTNKESIETCIKQVIHDLGKIDVIVNNAGIYTTNPLGLTPNETIDRVVETNIKGFVYTTKAILEHFRENKSGIIVNISSIAGRVTFPFQSIYHTSKWAIEGFSESLYYELKPLGIKVKVIEPGMVKTSIYNSVLDFPFEQYPAAYQANFKKWHRYLMKNFNNGYLPELDAKTIYKTVNSNSARLRYTSDFTTKAVFFLRSLLPLSLFQHIINKQSN